MRNQGRLNPEGPEGSLEGSWVWEEESWSEREAKKPEAEVGVSLALGKMKVGVGVKITNLPALALVALKMVEGAERQREEYAIPVEPP